MNGLWEFLAYFLLTCAVVALACSLVRGADRKRVIHEATHFFLMMVIGILVFSAVVHALDVFILRR